MTITAQTAKSGPYSGNGVTVVFDYTFKIVDDDDLVVTLRAADGTETVQTLTTDYTVAGGGDAAGGQITMVTAPATGEKLVITRAVDLTQEVNLENRGAFVPEVIEQSFDKLTQIAQDHQEQLDRSIKVDKFDVTDLDQLVSDITTLAAIDTDISTVAGVSSEVTTVAGNNANVTTVAGISGNVTTVAGIAADVTAVAADATDIGTVATNIANVNAVGGNIANVNTVAGISANVTTVAGDSADIATVAGISLNVSTVAGIQSSVSTVALIAADVTAVAADATDIGAVAAVATEVGTVAGIAADVVTVAADGTDIGTVAGISGNVTTVAGISGNVTTVAGIAADVTTVAADGADIGTVAGISSSVTTVAGNSANVTTVAGISANVTTVAGISADVTTAAANVADITNFADVYIGAAASDPTTRSDGSALQEGDLYFNTTDDVMKVYEGATWVAAYASLSGALLASNNLSDLASAATARTNLGLGTADSPTFAGLTSTGDVSLGDNDKAIFGAGSDLQIYHDGSDSYIRDAGVGNLLLQGAASVRIQSDDGLTTAALFAPAGLARLNYAGAAKLETTSTGVDVTGNITVSGTVDGRDVAADGALAASAVQPGDNISTLTNDSGYLTGITGQSIKNLSDVYSSMSPTDGQVLTYDTTNGWQAETAASGSSTVDYQEFTSSGTWSKPGTAASGDQVVVQVVGAGGAGYAGHYPDGGGGGGGAIVTFDDVDDFASTETVVVGAGGAGSGGQSNFGTAGNLNFILATGGTAAASNTPGAGGNVNRVSYTFDDRTSTNEPYTSYKGGDGGANRYGTGGRGGNHSVFGGGGGGAGYYVDASGYGGFSAYAGYGGNGATTNGGTAQAGQFPGGGGGGSYTGTKGNGANGVVRVWVIRET